jgi:hypothetical protein
VSLHSPIQPGHFRLTWSLSLICTMVTDAHKLDGTNSSAWNHSLIRRTLYCIIFLCNWKPNSGTETLAVIFWILKESTSNWVFSFNLWYDSWDIWMIWCCISWLKNYVLFNMICILYFLQVGLNAAEVILGLNQIRWQTRS